MTFDMSEGGRRRKELVTALVGGMASFTFCHDLIISATDLPCLLVVAVVALAVGLLDVMTAPSRLTEVRSRRLFKVIVIIIATVIEICAAALVIAFASSAVCIIVYNLLHVMRGEPPLAALLLILIPWLPVALLARRWARRLSIWMGLLLVLLLTALYFAVLGASVEALYPRYVEELKARHGNGRSLERAWGSLGHGRGILSRLPLHLREALPEAETAFCVAMRREVRVGVPRARSPREDRVV
jgi:hypothetical protein